LPLNFAVPDDLAELDRWVLWRQETRNGRPTKVPHQPNGRRASSTAYTTWTTFDCALSAWRRNPQKYEGIGFAFSKEDRFIGIDLDDALDGECEVKSWARGIVERFADTYAEVSPSGKGLKIWARGSLPANLPGAQVGDGTIEMYDHARYFTVTGRPFRGSPLQIEDHADDAIKLYEWLTASRKRWALRPLEGGRIPHGQQHNTLVSLCGTLRRRLVCEAAIEACLQIVNEKQCEKPGPREHITTIVRSSRRWDRNARQAR
jgi:primase-polymerase (primpol)-like protein